MSVRNYEEYRRQILDILDQESVPSDIRNFEKWRFKVLSGLKDQATAEALGSSIRSGDVYREEVLKALDVSDYTRDDIINEKKWRAKVLEAMGQEYTTEDINYFKRWREKVTVGLDDFAGGVWKTVSGSIASFDDALAKPMKSVVVQIVPKQSGSGDPSPDNIRPIEGWSGVNVGQSGKNLFKTYGREVGTPNPSSGGADVSPRVLDTSKYYVGLRSDNYYYPQYVPSHSLGENSISVSNGSNNSYGLAFPIQAEGGTVLTLNAIATNPLFSFGYYAEDWSFLSSSGSYNSFPCTITVPENVKYVTVVLRAITNGTSTYSNIQLELGTTATAYEPYQGESKYIPFKDSNGDPITVYGGEMDVVNGVLKSYPYYSSYNGETLSGEWICDRAVYAQGTTPPIGSQVVDMSGTGTEYNNDPTEIRTLKGSNNVWADTGDVEAEYRADTKLYIDKKIAETQAMVLENIGG